MIFYKPAFLIVLALFFFYFQDNLLEKLDDVELEAPSSQDEEVRITFDCFLTAHTYFFLRMNNLYLLFGA